MMNTNQPQDKRYISSKEARITLKISSCELMHLRTEGKLSFIKKGNAYLYKLEDVNQLIRENVNYQTLTDNRGN